jgi:large repetitive protein
MSRAIRRTADRAGRRARTPSLTACVTTGVVIAVLGAGVGTALAATVKSSASKVWTPSAASTKSTTTVTTAPLVIVTQSLASVKVNQRFSGRLVARGGHAPYSWHVSDGNLPSGVSLSPGGLLSGETATPGTDNIQVEVADSAQPTPGTAYQNLALIVTPARLHITTSSLPKAPTGLLYSYQLSAAGGVLPYGWKLWTGELPPGISLSGSGELTGTPTNRGNYDFQVQLSDSASPPVTTVQHFSLVVTTPRLLITTRSLPPTMIGQLYSVELGSEGGLPPLNWAVKSGSLPAGLSLSGSGTLSGTSTAAGTSRFTVKLSDSSTTPLVATANYELTVDPVPLSLATTSFPPATVGTPYSASVTATGGTSPYFFSIIRSSLPAGLQMTSAGSISGTPDKPGTFRVRIRAKDSSSKQLSTTRSFRMVVDPVPMVISTTGLPAASLNNPYAAALATSGGTAPFTWQITSGTLPSGIVMSSAGYLSGITPTPGVYTFTVEVTDSSPVKQTSTATVTIIAASTAANWSGYLETGSYTEVTGTFTVPTTVATATAGAAVCTTSSTNTCPSEVAQWVGLDGITGSSLIQAGVIEQAGQSDQAFWEILPGAANGISMTVSPGDQVTVTIFKASSNLWAIAVDDDTTGQLFRTEQTYTGPGSTADFVVEAPSPSATSSTVFPLASFSPATDFTNLQTVGYTTATAALVLVEAGVQVATPSLKTSTGFAVGYGSLAPSPPVGK